MIYTTFEAFKNYVNQHQPTLAFSPKEKAKIVVTGSYKAEDYHPSHRAVFVPFTGTNAIDIKLLKEKGIALFNSQAHSHYVAERALALILTLLGKIIPYHEGLTKGDWANRNGEERIPWTSLFHKRVGFLGYGTINQILHTLLKAFEIQAFTLDR